MTALLTQRLFFCIGKGGVGKTTIATALALIASRQGRKTLLIELDGNTRAAHLLGLPRAESNTPTLRQVSPTLFVLAVSGHAALEEYLRLIIPTKRLLRTVFESRLYQYFVTAAPGLKELLMMGKVWYEAHKRDAQTQKSVWDVLIVDTPATGHSLQYLRMPQAARDTFRGGLVHREAERVIALLSDPQETAIHLVTTPEELPVNETLETYQRLVENLQLPLGVLFVNRLHTSPLDRTLLERARVKGNVSLLTRRLAEHVLTLARTEASLAQAQAEYLQKLTGLPLPLVPLPFCFAEEFSLPEVERLSHLIAVALTGQEQEKSRPAQTGARRGMRR